jgi:hypothetical protein
MSQYGFVFPTAWGNTKFDVSGVVVVAEGWVVVLVLVEVVGAFAWEGL